ncbi:hypothetical protein COOONC_01221 [Cooperia oncophora]
MPRCVERSMAGSFAPVVMYMGNQVQCSNCIEQREWNRCMGVAFNSSKQEILELCQTRESGRKNAQDSLARSKAATKQLMKGTMEQLDDNMDNHQPGSFDDFYEKALRYLAPQTCLGCCNSAVEGNNLMCKLRALERLRDALKEKMEEEKRINRRALNGLANIREAHNEFRGEWFRVMILLL